MSLLTLLTGASKKPEGCEKTKSADDRVASVFDDLDRALKALATETKKQEVKGNGLARNPNSRGS